MLAGHPALRGGQAVAPRQPEPYSTSRTYNSQGEDR